MGTRSIVYFCDGDYNGNVICAIEQQYDGSPCKNGVGGQISEFLEIVNYIKNSPEIIPKCYNNMGILAAEYICRSHNSYRNPMSLCGMQESLSKGEKEFAYWVTKKYVYVHSFDRGLEVFTWDSFMDYVHNY